MLTLAKHLLITVSVLLFAPFAYGQVGNQNMQNGQSGQVSSSGEISSQTSNDGFVGGGGIGGDPRATSSQSNQGGMGGFGGMGGMGGMGGFGGMGRGMMGGMFGGQQQQQPGANLRFPFVVKFQIKPILPAKVRQQAQTRLGKLPGLSRYNKVAVDLADGTATLTGNVVSEREKSLVERLVLLEPGINSVENNLLISEAVQQDN